MAHLVAILINFHKIKPFKIPLGAGVIGSSRTNKAINKSSDVAYNTTISNNEIFYWTVSSLKSLNFISIIKGFEIAIWSRKALCFSQRLITTRSDITTNKKSFDYDQRDNHYTPACQIPAKWSRRMFYGWENSPPIVMITWSRLKS